MSDDRERLRITLRDRRDVSLAVAPDQGSPDGSSDVGHLGNIGPGVDGFGYPIFRQGQGRSAEN